MGHNPFLGGEIFAFTLCLKQIFLGGNIWQGTAPECPAAATGLYVSLQTVFPK